LKERFFLFTKAKKDRRRKNSVEIIGEKEKKKLQ